MLIHSPQCQGEEHARGRPCQKNRFFVFCGEWKESDMEVTLAKMCVLYVRFDYSTWGMQILIDLFVIMTKKKPATLAQRKRYEKSCIKTRIRRMLNRFLGIQIWFFIIWLCRNHFHFLSLYLEENDAEGTKVGVGEQIKPADWMLPA